MLEKELRIKITADRSQSKRELQEFQREHQKVTREIGESEKEAWGSAKTAIGGASSALASYAGQMVGLNSASAIIGTIAQRFQDARQQAYDATRMVQDYHAALRELAALRGQLGQTGATMAETFGVRRVTGQRQAESIAYMTQALNIGQSVYTRPPGVTPPITEKEFRRGAGLAGAFQTLEGGDAATHATLYGLAAQMMGAGGRTDMKGEDVVARMQQYYKIMQPGGFSFTEGIKEVQAITPEVMTGVITDRRALAILTALSTTKGDRGGEAPSITFQHLLRATLGAVGKMTKARVEGSARVGESLKRLGISTETLKKIPVDQQVEVIANRLIDDIKRAKGEAAAKGEEFNPLTYLTHDIGYGNEQDAKAIMAYMSTKPALEGIQDLARPEAEPAPGEVAKNLESLKRTSPTYQAQQVELAGEAAMASIGEKNRKLIQSKQLAFNQLISEEMIPKTKEQFGTVATSWWGTPENILFGYNRMISRRAYENLFAEGERVGAITPELRRRALPKLLGMGDVAGGKGITDKDIEEMMFAVEAAGGSTVPEAVVGGVVNRTQQAFPTPITTPGGPPAPMSGRPPTVPGRVGEISR